MSNKSTSNTLLHKTNADSKWNCYWADLSDSQIKLFKQTALDKPNKPPIYCINITSQTKLLIQSDNIKLAGKLQTKTNIKWVYKWCAISTNGYLHCVDLKGRHQIKTFDILKTKLTFRESQKILSVKIKNEWINICFDTSDIGIEWYNKLLETKLTCAKTRQRGKILFMNSSDLFVFMIKNSTKSDYFCANNISDFERWIEMIKMTMPKNFQSDLELQYPLDTKKFQLTNLTSTEREKIDMWINLISNKHNYTNINYSFLARYIIHAKFDFDLAEKCFLNFKNVETEYKLHSIKMRDIAAELQKGYYVICGKDYKNRPIVCLRLNKFDKNANISIVMKSLIVLMDSIASDLWVIKNGICLIFDLSNIDSNKNISLLDLEKIFIKGFQDAYPIMVKTFIVVNASIIPKAAISVAKTVLTKKLSERIECVTSVYPKGKLWKFVDINQVPLFLNGKYKPQNAWKYVLKTCKIDKDIKDEIEKDIKDDTNQIKDEQSESDQKHETYVDNSPNIDNGKYNYDIINQLSDLQIGSKEEIIDAINHVNNKNDINEITEYLDNKARTDEYNEYKMDINDNKQNENDILSSEESNTNQFYKFLKRMKMEKYFDKFKENDICDMQSIESFDGDGLKEEIEIKSGMARKKFLKQCEKTINEMEKFKNEYGISVVLYERLAKYGIVTISILCEEVKQRSDLKLKFKITYNNQMDLLWNLVQKMENINVEGHGDTYLK